jgi:hypothetical protein
MFTDSTVRFTLELESSINVQQYALQKIHYFGLKASWFVAFFTNIFTVYTRQGLILCHVT